MQITSFSVLKKAMRNYISPKGDWLLIPNFTKPIGRKCTIKQSLFKALIEGCVECLHLLLFFNSTKLINVRQICSIFQIVCTLLVRKIQYGNETIYSFRVNSIKNLAKYFVIQ